MGSGFMYVRRIDISFSSYAFISCGELLAQGGEDYFYSRQASLLTCQQVDEPKDKQIY